MVFTAKENKKLKGRKPNENRSLLLGEHIEAKCALRSGTEITCTFTNSETQMQALLSTTKFCTRKVSKMEGSTQYFHIHFLVLFIRLK